MKFKDKTKYAWKIVEIDTKNHTERIVSRYMTSASAFRAADSLEAYSHAHGSDHLFYDVREIALEDFEGKIEK